MTCADVDEHNLIERYLVGQLSEADRDLFESHLFECDRCPRVLKTMRALQGELAEQRTTILAEPLAGQRFRYWIPAGALAAAASIAAVLWLYPAPPRLTVASNPSPAASPPVTVRPPSPEALTLLARVEPPAYTPMTLRSAGTPGAFEVAMQAYDARQYRQAAEGLRRVIAGAPGDVQAKFYLAVSLLMTDDVGDAIVVLREVTAAGDSPVHQTATVLLAKGLIRTGDLDGAERELARAGSGIGVRAQEAADLLAELRALRGGARPRN